MTYEEERSESSRSKWRIILDDLEIEKKGKKSKGPSLKERISINIEKTKEAQLFDLKELDLNDTDAK